eukprot:CAMPEP_0181309386 /NCGR_PEP_ID=MMETSP1101-20121128/11984_1 /TAXON_ID=46948 /ORGANISM="Rhodomonas abbreviata, Strain Caron Lab Isolate" /LENGTH=207 /DNA_ID=CAMNT_0023415863 /DNA_START=132 /DNA_END=752 /DNA_ORIENTATION=+
MATISETNGLELFNLPLSEPHVVIHIGDENDFHRLHLLTATQCPRNDPNPQDLAELFDAIGTEICPDMLGTVVLCGEELITLAQTLQEMIARKRSEKTKKEGDDEKRTMPVHSFRSRLLSQCHSIKLLPTRQLVAVAKDFPFLTEEGPPTWRLPPMMPSMITENLFLGSQVHAADADVLKTLGITAVVNVTSELPNFFEGSRVRGGG